MSEEIKLTVSPQQKVILELLADGIRVGEMPEKMNIKQVTVNLHMRALKDKLGALTRHHAVAIALRNNIID